MVANYTANKSMIRFTREKEDKIRGSFKATVRSSEKKYYVNRRNPFHQEMERVLCVMPDTPKLLSVGVTAAAKIPFSMQPL
jgi:hypothetical protein